MTNVYLSFFDFTIPLAIESVNQRGKRKTTPNSKLMFKPQLFNYSFAKLKESECGSRLIAESHRSSGHQALKDSSGYFISQSL